MNVKARILIALRERTQGRKPQVLSWRPCPLPKNFAQWPEVMQKRYLRSLDSGPGAAG